MAEIIAADAADHVCPFNDFAACRGPSCMAFEWSGPTHDRCETDNLVETEEGPRPMGAPASPEGDGWEMDGPSYAKGYHRSEKDKLPKATGQRWIRAREQIRGRCSRVGGGYY